MSLTTIISGGQTGADRTALEVAEEFGIITGGWAPKGFKTEDGPALELGGHFGLLEHHSSNYPDRTYANAQISDATIWFGNIGTPGYRCTIGAAKHFEKPWRVNPTGQELATFILRHQIKVLNVAGNRSSRNPEVIRLTRETLTTCIQLLRQPAV